MAIELPECLFGHVSAQLSHIHRGMMGDTISQDLKDTNRYKMKANYGEGSIPEHATDSEKGAQKLKEVWVLKPSMWCHDDKSGIA